MAVGRGPDHEPGDGPVEGLTLGRIVTRGRSEIRVGTCSWTDQTLVRETNWYPRKTMAAAARLAFYAARFPVVEVDSTYYRAPGPEQAQQWAERTPEGFRMNVKAFSLLTGHPTRIEALWEDLRSGVLDEHRGKKNVYPQHLDPDALDELWDRFTVALRPLRAAGRLGAVLLQYPQWFTPRRENRAELAKARARLGDLPACVEFRSPRWLHEAADRDRTLGLLREHEFSLVVVDAPSVSGLDTVVAVTDDRLAVVRFHGRADDLWHAKVPTAAERFKYLYSADELRPWAERLAQLADRAAEVHALMNNCYQDYGVRNAADLMELLESPD